jgi:hypothetical protein
MRCLPSEERVKGGGEWNHYKVVANDGVIKLHVNGKEVSGVSKCTPRKGYLALESEGAECHFKNIKIKELPSTNPEPKDVGKVWEGHKNIFTGLDLSGWKAAEGSWKAGGGVLRCTGKDELVSDDKYGPCELIYDWRMPAKAEKAECVVVVGGTPLTSKLPEGTKPGSWQRHVVRSGTRMASPIVFQPSPGLEIRSIFIKELTMGGK